MKAFSEHMRYEYSDITSDDWILDIGANIGNSTEILFKKYGCFIVCYEPVTKFFDQLVDRFKHTDRVITVPMAVGDSHRREMFGVKGDLSGSFCDSAENESVTFVPIVKVIERWIIEFNSKPKLLCINAEGGEHQILESLLDNKLDQMFSHIQVQPHAVVPNAVERWAKIRERLLEHFDISSEDPDLGTGWLLLDRK